MLLRLSVSLLALCLACPASVRAEVIIGNLAGSNDGNFTGVHNNVHRALSFAMGAQSYTLDAVVLRLDYFSGTPIVELRNDGGTQPGGTIVASFTVPPVNGGGIQSYSFAPTATTILQAGTTYWLEVYGSGVDFNFPTKWYRSSPDLTPSGSAATWLDSRTYSGGSWGSSSSIINTFELQGTQISAVPEPTSLVLVAGAAAVAGWRRRFRRR